MEKISNFKHGYTIVELIIVIAVMVIIGVVAIANYGAFGKDQALQRGVSDIQSFIRTAQTNATARVPCPPTSSSDTDAGASWKIKFNTDGVTLSMFCQLGSSGPEIDLSGTANKYKYTLGNNVSVYRLNTDNINCAPSQSYVITFAPLYGDVTFTDGGCAASPNLLIILRNSSTGSTKNLVIDKGGSVYEQ